MLHIYYGMGKGKTSTLNGTAVRATGAAMRVKIYRFLKGRPTSEDDVLIKAGIPVQRVHYGEKFVINMNEAEKLQAKNVIDHGLVDVLAHAQNYEMLLLDELLDLTASTVGFLTEDDLVEFIKKLPPQLEVLISGHEALPKVFALADLITYYKPEKHYFEKGVQARKGIEF